MHFTHTPAPARNRRPRVTAHHPWTDVIIDGDDQARTHVRVAYRTARACGVNRADARYIVWQMALGCIAGKARLSDHDLRYS